jgi:hypothetical protein
VRDVLDVASGQGSHQARIPAQRPVPAWAGRAARRPAISQVRDFPLAAQRPR